MRRHRSTADLAHLRVHLRHIRKQVLCLLWYFISQGSFEYILQQWGSTGKKNNGRESGKEKRKNIVTVLNVKRLVGNELFDSCGNHTIVKLSLSDRRNQIALYCGQGNASGNQDGVVSSGRLHSPHGLVNMGSSLIVCDAGNRSVRVISNGKQFQGTFSC